MSKQHPKSLPNNVSSEWRNPPTRNNTLKKIHKLFLEAIYESSSDIDFLQKFFEKVKNQDKIPKEDVNFWNFFVDGLRNCLRTHTIKDSITENANYLGLTQKYILIWLISKLSPKEEDWKIRIIIRRKSIFAHLMKILKKSLKCDYQLQSEECFIEDFSSAIHDFLGSLEIILNPYDTTKYTYHPAVDLIYKTMRGIFSGQLDTEKQEFLAWLNKYPCNPITKMIIEQVLEIPFKTTRFKNYITNPKPNNYRTVQWTFLEEEYSRITPGSEIEFQVRDNDMHLEAIFGKAAHKEYKNLSDFSEDFKDPEFSGLDLETLLNVFTIDNFSKVHIPGFTHYDAKYLPLSDSCLDATEVTYDGDPYGFNIPKIIFQDTV